MRALRSGAYIRGTSDCADPHTLKRDKPYRRCMTFVIAITLVSIFVVGFAAPKVAPSRSDREPLVP